MAARPNRPQLAAVDANVLFDLADGLEDVIDALSVIRERLPDTRFLIPPTVQHELANWALRGDGQKRKSARKAIQLGQSWRIVPVNLIAVRHGIAERIAERIREQRLIPHEEVNDSLVLAESALLDCSMLLTSDEHLHGIDFERLTLELQAFDVTAPVSPSTRPASLAEGFLRASSDSASRGRRVKCGAQGRCGLACHRQPSVDSRAANYCTSVAVAARHLPRRGGSHWAGYAECPGSLLLLDDRTARSYARAMGLRITGTAGLLLRAKGEDKIARAKPLHDRFRHPDALEYE